MGEDGGSGKLGGIKEREKVKFLYLQNAVIETKNNKKLYIRFTLHFIITN